MNRTAQKIVVGGVSFTLVQKGALFIMGPPCGGKGQLRKAFSDPEITHYGSSTELKGFARTHGRQDVLDAMNSGNLVDLEVMKLIGGWTITDFLAHRSFGLFDGFGRQEEELQYFMTRLRQGKTPTVHLLFLEAKDDVLLERCERREQAKEENRLDHDQIEKRIKLWRSEEDKLHKVAQQSGFSHRILDTSNLEPSDVLGETLEFLGVKSWGTIAEVA
jgi:adenylate kinase family enzyme